MFLHSNRARFGDTISTLYRSTGVSSSILEKDYYVYMTLRSIVEKCGIDNVVFKGGTSLSKAYNAIDRFSEDIDLCLPDGKTKNSSARTRLVKASVASMREMGFNIVGEERIQSRGVYNCIDGKYKSVGTDKNVEVTIKVELTHMVREFPVEVRTVSSYLGDYMFKTTGSYEGLDPFQVNTISIYRTFVDKLYAIGDYYMKDKVHRYSRHIYDIHKLSTYIDINSNMSYLRDLLVQVKDARQGIKICVSSNPGVVLKQVITAAITSDFYKDDYNKLTRPILFEDVSYEDCKNSIMRLLNSGLFS